MINSNLKNNSGNYVFCDDTMRRMSVLEKVYYTLFVFASIYIEFGYKMVVADAVPGIIRIGFLIVLCIPLVVKLLSFKFQIQSLIVFIYLACLIMVNSLRDSNLDNYIMLLIPIFIGFVVASSIPFDKITCIFNNVVIVLAAFSLVVFVILVVAPGALRVLPVLPDPFDTTTAEVRDAGLSVVLMRASSLRNFGITWEPGAFSILLCASLYCNLTFYKKIRMWKIVVLTIAIITTFSTMGYFVMIAIYMVSVTRSYKSIRGTIFVLFAIVVLALGLFFMPDNLKDLVFDKLEGMFTNNASETTQARIDAIVYPFRAFLSSPFVGIGYDEFAILNKVECNSVATNTVMNWFAVMGILLGAPCLFFYMRFIACCVKMSKGGAVKFIILALACILMVSTESLLRISFMYIIIFYGTQKRFLEYTPKKSKKSRHHRHAYGENPVRSYMEESVVRETETVSEEEKDYTALREKYKTLDIGDTEDSDKKVLFLLGMYHPHYSANGLCVKNIIENGRLNATCVANSCYGEEKVSVIDSVEVYRVRERMYYRISQWCQRNKDKTISQFVGKLNAITNKVKVAVMSPFWPLVSPLYTYRIYKTGKKLLSTGEYDTMVAVYHPIDAALAGARLKRDFPDVTFAVYYLDALAGGWGPSIWSQEKIDRQTRKYEEIIDLYADVVISMESSRTYHNLHPLSWEIERKREYLDVPLLSPCEKVTEEVEKNEEYTFLFAGGLFYPNRDPEPILKMMTEVCERKGARAIFLGETNVPELFEKYEKESDGRISYKGKVSHDEVSRYEKSADCLINIGSTNPSTVTGKIFEYMSCLKPIISTYSIDNEPSLEYLNKYGYALLIDERGNLSQNIERIIEFIDSVEEVPYEYEQLEEMFSPNSAKAFKRVLNLK